MLRGAVPENNRVAARGITMGVVAILGAVAVALILLSVGRLVLKRKFDRIYKGLE
jgi:hypothetical protein